MGEFINAVKVTDNLRCRPIRSARWNVFLFVAVAAIVFPVLIVLGVSYQDRPTIAVSNKNPKHNQPVQDIKKPQQQETPPVDTPPKQEVVAADEKLPEKVEAEPVQEVEPIEEAKQEVKEEPIPPVIEKPAPPPVAKPSPTLISDKAKVNAWLKENLNSGTWQEIRWWPAIEIKFTKRTRRICAMKIRTENALGAKVVQEIVFETGGNEARELKTGDWSRDQSRFDPDGLNWTAWEYLNGTKARPDPGNHNGMNMLKMFHQGNLDGRDDKDPRQQNKKKKK